MSLAFSPEHFDFNPRCSQSIIEGCNIIGPISSRVELLRYLGQMAMLIVLTFTLP